MEEYNNVNEYDMAESAMYKNLFSIEDKTENELRNDFSINDLDEAEAKSYFAIFDYETGKSVEINTEIDMQKYQKVNQELFDDYTSCECNKNSDKDNSINEISQLLNSLIERKDIKSVSISINIDGKAETLKTNEELGITRNDIVKKIKSSVKDFNGVVIVYSKQELLQLQREYCEKNGIEIPDDIKALENINDADTVKKSYSDIKMDFINQINSNEKISKGYIRISDDDFTKLGDKLDKKEIPYLSKESEIKNGVNIIVPDDKMDQLKALLIDMQIDCLQIVHGNVDWHDIKNISRSYSNVAKEDLLEFQKKNNDKYNYIAFENKKGFSVYVHEDCNIEVKSNVNKRETLSNSHKRKTISEVKKQVDKEKSNTETVNNTSKENNKKINHNKEK